MAPNLLPNTLYLYLLAIIPQFTSAQTTPMTVNNTAASPTPTSNYPIKTIFLPLDVPPNLGASIVTAAPNATEYALSCLSTPSQNSDDTCAFATPVTITEGPGTLVYTIFYHDDEGATTNAAPATINCALSGSPSVTAATCIGRSAIAGLGEFASTSTLAYSQILYATLAVTAGREKLEGVREGEGRAGGSSSSEGVGARATAGLGGGMRWVAGAALGVAAAVVR
ncbi:uncharacterized protein LTR77_004597 [Saxophila tyrrhenica]|uniref:Uncharacterized protein n=1 Tax=Saxophila tyrrhenica TaxID=1690608 RepID=A0AAV9PD82_9PEZI|nr:hypothetical protein LTR77_004597 [Saxophila tyrrhenica]